MQGPAYDSTAPASYGLTLSYHDSTSTDPKASGIFRLFRPVGQYQWQLSTENGGARLAMQISNDHVLTLIDPAHPEDPAGRIVLRPGVGQESGVFWNQQRLAAMAEVLPLNNGSLTIATKGNVGIGTSTPGRQLTITGAFQFPATTSATTGIIYQGADPFIHSYGVNNLFFGANAGNLTLTTSAAIQNTAIGANALRWITTGDSNLAVGANALLGLRTGAANVAIGDSAMGHPVPPAALSIRQSAGGPGIL